MTQFRPPDDDPIEALFAEAREDTPSVPRDLIARVMADAVAELPAKPKPALWGQVLRTLGGWPAMAALAMTACVGLWMGGTLSEDLVPSLTPLDSVAFETGTGLGAFDLLLVGG